MLRREIPEGGRARKIVGNIYNLNSFCLDWFDYAGKYEFAKLRRAETIPENLFPYDERNKWSVFHDLLPYISVKPGSGALHFYCHDTEFEAVWLRAHLHPHMPAVIRKAGVTLTPDFSVFYDYPRAAQIWNIYRSLLLRLLL